MSKKVLTKLDFPIGTRVAMKTNHSFLGTVIANSQTDNNKFIIEWDNGEVGTYCHYDNIILLSDLESDFKVYQEKINTKLKEAADALSEASKLAKEKGLNLNDYSSDGLYDTKMFPAIYEFMDAVDSMNVGWSSSSMNC